MGKDNPAQHSQPWVPPPGLSASLLPRPGHQPIPPLTSPWPSRDLHWLKDLSSYKGGLEQSQRETFHQGLS